MSTRVLVTGALLLVAAAEVAVGGTPALPSDTEIRAQPRMRLPEANELRGKEAQSREEMERALQAIGQPDIEARLGAFPDVAVPPTGIDFDKLAEQYQDMKAGAPKPERADVYVFVSLGMPRASLERIVQEAEQAKAVIVMRGLHRNSMKQTVSAVRELLGERQVGWQIDPTKFERFAVDRVPATVVVVEPEKSCPGACEGPPPKHYKITGDVSLGYALEKIVTLRPEAKRDVSGHLARLGQ